MKVLVVFFLLFMCLVSVWGKWVPPGMEKEDTTFYSCDGKKDGLYIGDCTHFYKCQNETTEMVPCPHDLVVNRKQMWCDYKDLVSPPCGTAPNCSKVIDGNYPDLDRKCHYYFTCQRGDFFGYTKCAANLLFNPEKNNCDWSFLVKPPCGDAPDHVYPMGPGNDKHTHGLR